MMEASPRPLFRSAETSGFSPCPYLTPLMVCCVFVNPDLVQCMNHTSASLHIFIFISTLQFFSRSGRVPQVCVPPSDVCWLGNPLPPLPFSVCTFFILCNLRAFNSPPLPRRTKDSSLSFLWRRRRGKNLELRFLACVI